MRKLLFGLAAALLATTASAQEAKPFLGVGAEVGGDSLVVTVPMNVSPGIRVEPFLGYQQLRTTNKAIPTIEDTDWESTLTLGAKLLLLKEVGNNVELSFGGGLAINRVAAGFETVSSGVTASGDDSAIGFGVAAIGGAEYYFSPRFALGIEGQLFVNSIEVNDIRDTAFGTSSFVTARLYFQ